MTDRSDRHDPDAARIREAYVTGEAHSDRTPDCPSDEEFWDLCGGTLHPDRRDALLDHAIDCARCTEAMAIARDVRAEMPSSDAPARATDVEPVPATRRHRPGWWVGLAAAVVLVLFVPTLVDRDGSRDADALRDSGGDAAVLRSLVEGPLSRDAFTLSWSGAPEGSIYAVEIATDDLRSIDRAENLREAAYRVPLERFADVEPGASLLWRVEADLPDGSRVELAAMRVALAD